MSNVDRSNPSDGSSERVGTNRRNVLLGATGLVAATAAASMLGGGVSQAAALAIGPMVCDIAGIGQFEVLAWSWGASNSGTTHQGGGGGAGKASIQDLSMTKYQDQFSPVLLGALLTGVHVASAVLSYGDKKTGTAVRLEVREVLVTSLSMGGSSGEDRLTENLTLNFAEVTFTHGTTTISWDVVANHTL